MNALNIIRAKQLKRQKLTEAQRIMAKAYRGVAYTDLQHDRPAAHRTSDLTYRGINYSIN